MERVDVLVVGGGTGGAAAAWQAARAGASVLVLEESPWLGGMVTAAGVSALDGNEGALGSGFFRRFRDALERHYGGPEHVRTGWVSNTCFEPHVGARWLSEELRAAGVRVLHGARLREVVVEGRRVLGARFELGGAACEVRAHVTIEATEYGDVLLAADVPHRLGREARAETGEPDAPERADLEVQDPTYCAILQRHPGRAPAVPAPAGYDPRAFDGALREFCSTPDEALLNHALHDWQSFITYAALPGGKYLLNWPFHANDFPADTGLYEPGAARERVLAAARQRTLAFVHFLQTELGHPEWGLADGEFDTHDRLPHIPYVRESRRVLGMQSVREQDVVPLAGCARPPLRAGSIAVGDYFIDHHHSKAHLPPGERLVERYPKNAPFQVPYGALVPRDHDGLLCAEKSFAATHVANGCTRLQPVVMQVGQAAGLAAALCVRQGVEPRDLGVQALQLALVAEGSMLVPFRDVGCDEPEFARLQRGYATGSIGFGPATPLAWRGR
jgi:hypothetical protein